MKTTKMTITKTFCGFHKLKVIDIGMLVKKNIAIYQFETMPYNMKSQYVLDIF